MLPLPDSNAILSLTIKPDSLLVALDAAGIGTWDMTLGENASVTWDDRCQELFGMTRGNHSIPYEQVVQCIHEDDRLTAENAVKKALQKNSGGHYDVSYRTIGQDGHLRLLRAVGKVVFDHTGEAIRFSGIAIDISHEITIREEQQKLKVLVENSPDFMGISNMNGNIEHLNRAAILLLGIDDTVEIKKLRSGDFYPEAEHGRMREIYQTLIDIGSWSGTVFLKHFETGELIPGFGSYETVINFETGKPIGKSVTIRDLRPEIRSQKALQENEAMFRDVTQHAPTGLWMSDETGYLIYLNKTLVEWSGMPYEYLLGNGWAKAIVEEDRQRSADAFLNAVVARTHYDVEFRLQRADGTVFWCRSAGDPYYREDGSYAGYVGFCLDIHERVEMIKVIAESEARVRNIVEQAPVAIGVLRGENFTIESANDTILKLWGKNASIIGKPILAALPEIKEQGFIELLQQVYQSGTSFHGNSTLARIEHQGALKDYYFDFVYAALKDSNGIINGILIVASDVSKQVHSKQIIEESEAKFRSLIEEAPVATCVFLGRELVIDVVNEPMLNLWGKTSHIIGMPLAQAVPELEGQPFLKILDDIFITGKSYSAEEAKAQLEVNGKLTTYYFNFTYKPLFDKAGKVYAIIDMAIDVTEQVLNKQKIMEAEAQLRTAIETAKLGTWEVNLITKEIKVSARLKEWFGIGAQEDLTFKTILEAVPDHKDLISAFKKSRKEKDHCELDIEYTLVNKKTRREYNMHTQGQTFFDANGLAYLVIGSTRDITIQKQNEAELERLVQERTEQLQSTNEEIAATNEELADSNENLFRSNEELAQYAYIASHDLQEPLRKIRVFSDILSKQKSLSNENRVYVHKINQSSERMTMLIRDLLEFSKLVKSDKMLRPVDLNLVMKDVVTDFELLISEKKAIVLIHELPVIEAVALQMNQLFYNLLSNALKFIDPGKIPEINISSRAMADHEIKKYIQRPIPQCTYYDISIRDNGIGFEVKYAEQIFEVFKRLHGRDIYPGTGIGLALCRRIADNHGGYLYAESEPGSCTTFHLLLPDKN